MSLMPVSMMVLSAEGIELSKHDNLTSDDYLVKRRGYINPSKIDAISPCEKHPGCIFVVIGCEEYTIVANMEKFVTRVRYHIARSLIQPLN